jgi:hypothetical protein
MVGLQVGKIRFNILCLVLFLFVIFFLGFHNMDNCHNVLVLNAELRQFDVSYAENNFYFRGLSAAGCYMLGASFMLYAGVCGLLLCMFLLFERRNI